MTDELLAEAGPELGGCAVDITYDRRTLETCRTAVLVDHRKLARVRRRIRVRASRS